jgi:hypothetical protein
MNALSILYYNHLFIISVSDKITRTITLDLYSRNSCHKNRTAWTAHGFAHTCDKHLGVATCASHRFVCHIRRRHSTQALAGKNISIWVLLLFGKISAFSPFLAMQLTSSDQFFSRPGLPDGRGKQILTFCLLNFSLC